MPSRRLSVPDQATPCGMMAIALPDSNATGRLAALVAAHLIPGDVLLVDGPLGAGKTTLVRGLVAALGGDAEGVSSPTFTLLHQYPARLAVVHVDAWRLTGAGELEGLGFDELREGGVAVVEWASRVSDGFTADTCWHITLAHALGGGRQATIQPPALRRDEWLQVVPPSWMVTAGGSIPATPQP